MSFRPSSLCVRRRHRADQLARRVLALLARHRLADTSLGASARPRSTCPRGSSASRGCRIDLLLADDRDVVLRLARRDARAAARCRRSGRSPCPTCCRCTRSAGIERELLAGGRSGAQLARPTFGFGRYSSTSTTRTGSRPSIAKWFCVEAIVVGLAGLRRPSAPPSNQGAFDVRRRKHVVADAVADAPGLASARTRSARRRRRRRCPAAPTPACAIVRPWYSISSTSWPWLPGRVSGTPSRSAVRAPTYATLSHVTFESGFGSSCSQPLLAKRPSRIVGSGRKTISYPPAPARRAGGSGVAVGAGRRRRARRTRRTCRA